MSSWYKKAALGNDLTFVITTWLRNAKNHPQPASAHDDISYQMQGADNAEALSGAINIAVTIVSREQGGLTPSQNELIQHLQARNQDQTDPMAINSMELKSPFENQNELAPQNIDQQPM